MPVLSDSVVFLAFLIGIISAASLPLGALTSFFWKPDQRIIAALMAFGAGSLLAALTLDLVASALKNGHFISLAVGSIIGGILFIFLDNVVNNIGGYKRKFATAIYHRNIQNRKKLQDTLWHLGRVELFHDLNDQDIVYLSQNIENRFYAKGSKIFLIGEITDELFIIQKGSVELKNEFKKEILVANDGFGKASLFSGLAHVFNATAIEDCFISIIPKKTLESFLLISDSFKEHTKQWLASEEMKSYLKNDQNFDDLTIEKWHEALEESFSKECILPDVVTRDNSKEKFFEIGSQINRISWLEELDADDIEDFVEVLTYKTYKKDSYLYTQGEPAQYLYIIDQGEVIICDENDTNYRYLQTRKDALGNLSFICGLRHTTSAKAESDVGVWILRRESLTKLIEKNHNFKLKIQFFLQSNTLNGYLQKRYSLNQGTILSWIDKAMNNLKAEKLPPSLLELGIESSNAHGASFAIWLGILLDGIPESLIIGANMIHSTISLSLVAGLFLSNYPEALSSSRGMRDENLSRWRIFIMWSSIMIFTGVGAALGNIFMQNAEAHWFAFLEGLAAGAMLTMIAQTMLPEAYIKGGSITGLATLMGFLVTISLKTIEN